MPPSPRRQSTIPALTQTAEGMHFCCRRATGGDADRNSGTHFILELSFGVSDHFVHIVGVNERSTTLSIAATWPESRPTSLSGYVLVKCIQQFADVVLIAVLINRIDRLSIAIESRLQSWCTD